MNFYDIFDKHLLGGRVNLSGFILINDLGREELQYMTVDERLMPLGVENLGVIVMFGFPGAVSLGVKGVVYIRVPSKVALWVPGKISF